MEIMPSWRNYLVDMLTYVDLVHTVNRSSCFTRPCGSYLFFISSEQQWLALSNFILTRNISGSAFSLLLIVVNLRVRDQSMNQSFQEMCRKQWLFVEFECGPGF